MAKPKKKDPYARWKAHQQAIAKGIGCPALQDAVRKYGIENFEFTILIFCFDEDRFKYEKDYIKRYNSQVPNGYNITPGGEGGGFYGKKHTEESMQKMVQSMRKYYDDPEYITKMSARTKEQMKNTDISSIVRNSQKYKKALEEGRVGSRMHKTTKTKEEFIQIYTKVSESLKKYYAKHGGNKCDIEKHREHMAKAKGIRIGQYTKDGKLVATYNSISEAARQMNVNKNSLTRPLDDSTKSSKGFLWKTMKD